MKEKVVIIGSSITGVYTATALVRGGFDGRITLIDKKDVFPYNTYPLSKEWMMDLNEMDPVLLKDKEYYEENNIELKLNTAVDSIDWKKKTVTTHDNETIPYDYLVIGTGSKLRKISFPGDDAKGIFYLREYSHAKQIKEWAKKAKNIAIIGSGFIGLELVSSFNQLDKNVSMLIRSGKPLEKILGSQVADYFIDMHESHNANFMFNEEAKEFIKDEEGKLTSIITKSGKTIECDMAIIATGVKPYISFEVDGLETEGDTIIVNSYGETSLPDVYAGGDVVKWPYKDDLIHVEHWETAWSQGTSIAKNIIDKKSHEYNVIPYFWTDQYDHSFEYLGHATDWDKTLVRGSIKDGKFSVAYVDEKNTPLAILFVNGAEEREDIEKLLSKNQPLDEAEFVDTDKEISQM